MKSKITLILGVAGILISLLGTGCLPPPPHQAPHPPTPPGGPNTSAVHYNFGNLQG